MSNIIRINNFFEKKFILICVFLILSFFIGSLVTFNKHQTLKDALSRLEGNYARMQGAQEQEPELLKMLDEVQKILGVYIIDIEGPEAGSFVLQQLREKLTEDGLLVVSSQIKTPEADGSFMKTEILITAEGKISSVYNFLEKNFAKQKKYQLNDLEISLKGNLQSLNPEVEQILITKMSISFLQKGF